MRRSTSDSSARFVRPLRPAALALLAAGVLAGCADELPTATHPSRPVEPVTFEVRLPWSQFASNLRVLGGFGKPVEAPTGLVAHQFAGELEARTLVRFPNLPGSISVLDSLGTTRTDTLPNFIGSNVIVQLDTTSNTNTEPVLLRVDRIDAPWDAASATWEFAVDSLGVRVPWAQPGGGPLVQFAEGSFVPGGSNQVLMPLDSAETAFLRDTTQANRGIMISLQTSGHRLDVQRVILQLQVIPSIHQDTLVFFDVTPDPNEFTYIYTPEADPPPPDELRAGGVPAWRSVLTLALPPSVPGTAAACLLTTCPVTLTADRINHASLLLTTKPTDPPFAPSDTMGFEIRGVIAPEFLPKSPLASPLYIDSIGLPLGAPVQPAAFQPGAPRVVELAVTPLLRNLVAGTTGLFGPTPTITLMEVLEPFSFTFGSFVGPGQPGEPVLRLLLTVSDPVALP